MNILGGNKIQETFVGDLTAEADRQLAVDAMLAGQPVAVDNDAVGAICGDAENVNFVNAIYQMKDRVGKPFGLLLPFDDFAPLVDKSQVHESIWPLLDEPAKLQAAFGGITFVRAPLAVEKVEAAQIPECALSRDDQGRVFGQTYDASGKTHFERLVSEMLAAGIKYPAVTSLNQPGEPEAQTQEEMAKTAQVMNLPFLYDSSAKRTIGGSFNIIELHDKGYSIVRESNIHGTIIRSLLPEVPYMHRIPAQAHYPDRQLQPQAILPQGRLELSGDELRRFLKWQLGAAAVSHPEL